MNNTNRNYSRTHPWINFSFDFTQLDYETWILLGEANSKCVHIEGAPLLPDVYKDLKMVYLVKGAQATTAIEGNTLSEEEVEKRIRGDLELPPSKEYLGKEIDNIIKAINSVGISILSGKSTTLSVERIKEFNKMVLKDLPLKEEVSPGELRTYNVGIAGYKGAPPEDCEYLLAKYVDWFNKDFPILDGKERMFGIIKAILSHLYFVWIHPFGDGNGRTARLIEFQILLSVGLPDAAAHLLSNHYNITRSEYYRHLDEASKSGGNVQNFIKYALQGLVDGLKEQIEKIQDQQLLVHWKNYIFNVFDDKERSTDKRCRTLILEISKVKSMKFRFTDIRMLTPKIAETFANLSDKTLMRDISKLMDLKLIIEEDKWMKCNYKLMQSFLTHSRVLQNQS